MGVSGVIVLDPNAIKAEGWILFCDRLRRRDPVLHADAARCRAGDAPDPSVREPGVITPIPVLGISLLPQASIEIECLALPR